MSPRPPVSPSEGVARASWLGACAGALGAVADGLTATFLPYTRSPVRVELTVGCAIVDILASSCLAAGLSLVWQLTEGLGQRLHGAWPRLPGTLARSTPLAALLAVSLANDAVGLFSGPGVSKTALGAVGRWAFPLVGTPLAVAVLRVALAIHARLRSAPRPARLGAFVASLATAGVCLHAERLSELDPYFAIRRYCDLGALLSVLFGLALFGSLAGAPGRLLAGTRARTLGYALPLLAMCLSLPLLFPSSSARLELTSRRFVASPAVHGLRHLVDLDGDGYSPLLGGGDCNDFDRKVHPFQLAPPTAGIDLDCSGVDGWTAASAAPDPPPGPSDVQAAAALRARARGKNVLIVLVDALRFDRLQDPLAANNPHLTRLAHQGISFARALSPASRTPLAIPAIFDGRLKGQGNGLFRAFRAAGTQAGFVSIDVVLDQLRLSTRLGGDVDLVGVPTEGERSVWGGGVHVFTGHAITESALRWVDARPKPNGPAEPAPWLLWVHYFSAHQWDSIASIRSVPGMPRRYDAALADDDRSVGELLDGLAARGLSENTVVVLLADHGESLGDHGFRTHGFYLYPELVHVPMSILVPGVPPRTIPTYVTTASLTPTLLDLLGIAGPDAEGFASLVPLMVAAAPPAGVAPHPIVMHDTAQSAIALGTRFLRYTPAENATELFSLDDVDGPHPDDRLTEEPETATRLLRTPVSDLPAAKSALPAHPRAEAAAAE